LQHCSLSKSLVAVLVYALWPFSFVLLWCRRHKVPNWQPYPFVLLASLLRKY
jgi:hypothetical protein